MPFDMTPSIETDKHLIYKRLCVLRSLLSVSGDQKDWYRCLWSEVRRSYRMRELGVSGNTHTPQVWDRRLFGHNAGLYFSGSNKQHKQELLDEDIAELEKELYT